MTKSDQEKDAILKLSDSDKEQFINQLQSKVFKSLSHPTRLRIVKLLAGGPLCVCELVSELGEEYANVSRHLSRLASAGVVTSQRQGTNVIYSLNCSCIIGFIGCLTDFIISHERERARMTRDIT